MHPRNAVIAALVSLLCMAGCRQHGPPPQGGAMEGEKVLITGMLEGGQGQRVILEEMGAREFIPMDTVVCDQSGAFEISITPSEIAFYVLRYGPGGYVTLLLEPGETVEFSAGNDPAGIYEVRGSKGSELLRELSIEHKNALMALGEITRKNREMASSPLYSTLKPVYDRQFDSITSGFREYSLQFINAHSGSLAILVALYNMYGQGLPVFDPGRDLQVYRYVDSLLSPRYSGFEAVDLLNGQVKEAERVLVETTEIPWLQQGEIAPDFVSSRPDGTQLALSELRGNYVLLDFWAGWSHLSREEHPTLKRAMELYGKDAFRILQVSLDDDRELWIRAIREDGLQWDHVGDLMRWETPVVELYGIERIPSNILIDPSGRIVETDLFGEKLLEKLELIFTD